MLSGNRLRLLRAAWLAVVAVMLPMTAIGFVQVVRDPTLVAVRGVTELLDARGVDYRLFNVLVLLLPLLVVVAICALVFRRRGRDPMALLFTMTLLLLYAYSSRALLTWPDHPVLQHAPNVALGGALVGFALVLALFPDGRWAPRSARWLPVATFAVVVAFPDAAQVVEGMNHGEITWRSQTMLILWLVVMLLGLLAQAHRYRRVSGERERQQTKWVILPLGLLFAVLTAVGGIPLVFLGASERWMGWIVVLVVLPLLVLLPVSVAIAVLRYRLYEIDRIISRTVAYGLLVAVLGSLYAASVLVLGTAIPAVVGPVGGDLAVATSVLVVAAAFNPLRARVRAAVDRRFNRSGYAARLVISRFATRLRSDQGLEAVARELVTTATTAVQPVRASLWLAGDDSRR